MEPRTDGKTFICRSCGTEFFIASSILTRYQGWTPQQCRDCKGIVPRQFLRQQAMSTDEALARFKDGPETGVFTDGFCEPNPGRGGWGAVKVADGKIIEERHGAEDSTTNNRMELRALIEGYKMLRADEAAPIYSDSELCVNTITKWARTWEAKGWKRKGGEIKNLDLVKELYSLAQAKPRADLQWIRGHAGSRWNEYADALSRKGTSDQ